MVKITQFECGGVRSFHSLEGFLNLLETAGARRALAFAPERVRLVAAYADRLSHDPGLRASIPLQTFAFWTRKNAIEKLSIDFQQRLPAKSLAVGRGIAFHLPPINIDTIFLYSWVIAFLCGNVNVTRLPSTLRPAISRALDILLELLRDKSFVDMFVSYPISDEINAGLSSLSDLRFVWGGDEKVRSFEKLPLQIDGRSLVFPDRYSYSVVNGAKLGELRSDELSTLASNLCNDIFIFSQMACSSPHILYVVGAPDICRPYVRRFMEAIDRTAHERAVLIDPAHGIEKFCTAAQLAAEGKACHIDRFSLETMVIELSIPIRPRVGGGFLAVSYLSALNDLSARIGKRDQTLSYFGFSREQMEAFAQVNARHGLCRIVPVGQALSFDELWDGCDLLRDSVRIVRVF